MTRRGSRERTIAVLSPAFLESAFCQAEWAAAFRKDPTGRERRLVPVRVRECDPDGLLGSVVYVDLVGLELPESRQALLAGRAAPSARSRHTRRCFPARRVEREPRRPEAGAAIFNVPVMTRTFVGRERALEQLVGGLGG